MIQTEEEVTRYQMMTHDEQIAYDNPVAKLEEVAKRTGMRAGSKRKK